MGSPVGDTDPTKAEILQQTERDPVKEKKFGQVILPATLRKKMRLAERQQAEASEREVERRVPDAPAEWVYGLPAPSEPFEFTRSGSLNVEPAPSPNTTASPAVPNDGGSLGDESSVTLLRRLMGQIDAEQTQSVQFRSSMSSILDAAPASAPPQVGSSITPSTNELIERIIEAIEDRVIDELERRGRRYNPGVF
jgi:hypothetical protein